MRINNNLMAMNTHRQLGMGSANAAKSMEKLSSGQRINRAGDDAAGLAISEKMRAQIRGLNQASRNAQDGISLIQTAEGALQETQAILQRMRELAVQSANGTNETEDRQAIQNEVDQLKGEIDRIATTTEFNKKTLLKGELNVSAAVSAKVDGTTVGSTVKIVSAATSGNVTGSVDAATLNTIEIHSGQNPRQVGDKTYATHDQNDSGPDVTATSDELTVTLNGVTKTINLTVANYSAGGDDSADTFATDVQTQLNTAFGANSFKVGFTHDDKIYIEAGNKTDKFTVDGGNALVHFGTNGIPSDFTAAAEVSRNDKITLNVDGVERTVNLTNVLANAGTNEINQGAYDLSQAADRTDFLTQLNADLDAEFGAGNVVASFEAVTNKLVLTSASTGSTSTVDVVSAEGNLATLFGVDAANVTTTDGLDINNSVSVKIDGEDVTFTVANGDWNTMNLANELQSKINSTSSTAADVSVTFADGKFTITSGAEGAAGSVAMTDNAFAKSVGLSTGSTVTAGVDAQDNALEFQIGANSNQTMEVNINDMQASALGVDNLDVINNAQGAIDTIENALKLVSDERAKLGAYQNRLEHSIKNLDTSSENLQASESRIRDVDMAKEMMEFTKNNILQQAAQAMLAQAQQAPQGVLQLLR